MAVKLATAALQHSLLQQDGSSTTLRVIVAHGFPQGNCSGLVLAHGLEYLAQCRYMVDVRMHIVDAVPCDEGGAIGLVAVSPVLRP